MRSWWHVETAIAPAITGSSFLCNWLCCNLAISLCNSNYTCGAQQLHHQLLLLLLLLLLGAASWPCWCQLKLQCACGLLIYSAAMSDGSRCGCRLMRASVSCSCSFKCQGISAYTSVNRADSGGLGTLLARSNDSMICRTGAKTAKQHSVSVTFKCNAVTRTGSPLLPAIQRAETWRQWATSIMI